MFNTPSVFAVYVATLTLQWLKDLGGIPFIEKVNNKKAALLYAEIDRNPLFEGVVAKEDRSTMNATFVLTDPSLKDTFDTLWKEAGINGLTDIEVLVAIEQACTMHCPYTAYKYW